MDAALAAGVDVNECLRSGGTVLMRAASEGRLTVLQVLLRGGADVDAKRDDGITALMLASFFGHEDAVAALLAGGADVTAEDLHKFTPLRLASSKLHAGVVRILEQTESESRQAASSTLRAPGLRKSLRDPPARRRGNAERSSPQRESSSPRPSFPHFNLCDGAPSRTKILTIRFHSPRPASIILRPFRPGMPTAGQPSPTLPGATVDDHQRRDSYSRLTFSKHRWFESSTPNPARRLPSRVATPGTYPVHVRP